MASPGLNLSHGFVKYIQRNQVDRLKFDVSQSNENNLLDGSAYLESESEIRMKKDNSFSTRTLIAPGPFVQRAQETEPSGFDKNNLIFVLEFCTNNDRVIKVDVHNGDSPECICEKVTDQHPLDDGKKYSLLRRIKSELENYKKTEERGNEWNLDESISNPVESLSIEHKFNSMDVGHESEKQASEHKTSENQATFQEPSGSGNQTNVQEPVDSNTLCDFTVDSNNTFGSCDARILEGDYAKQCNGETEEHASMEQCNGEMEEHACMDQCNGEIDEQEQGIIGEADDLNKKVQELEKIIQSEQKQFHHNMAAVRVNGWRNAPDLAQVADKTNTKDGIHEKLNKPLHVHTVDPFVIGRELAYRLSEKKSNTLGHVARVLGIAVAIKIFEETKQVLVNGGLLTEDGKRQRTPGGTFLYLLKQGGYADAEQTKEIFREDRELKVARQKADKKQKTDEQTEQVELATSQSVEKAAEDIKEINKTPTKLTGNKTSSLPATPESPREIGRCDWMKRRAVATAAITRDSCRSPVNVIRQPYGPDASGANGFVNHPLLPMLVVN